MIWDWLIIAAVFVVLLLVYWWISDIISGCVEYWRAYREPGGRE